MPHVILSLALCALVFYVSHILCALVPRKPRALILDMLCALITLVLCMLYVLHVLLSHASYVLLNL